MKCCDMTAAKLRHSIIVQRETRTADGQGGSSIVWTTQASFRAYVQPVSGTERLFAQRIDATITHRIYARYRADIATSDRINMGGRLMQIKAIINMEERNKWIEIHAVEGEAT